MLGEFGRRTHDGLRSMRHPEKFLSIPLHGRTSPSKEFLSIPLFGWMNLSKEFLSIPLSGQMSFPK
jgi:hypothetical protein